MDMVEQEREKVAELLSEKEEFELQIREYEVLLEEAQVFTEFRLVGKNSTA